MGTPGGEITARIPRTVLIAALGVLAAACEIKDGRTVTDTMPGHVTLASSATVPDYLRAPFAALDTLLSASQRDSLRALTLDEAFRFRTGTLHDAVRPMDGAWQRTPLGDSLLAHREEAFMTTNVLLDLYQQQLRGQSPNLADALRRVSPEYVERLTPSAVQVDSILLSGELDDSAGVERLVRELRVQPMFVDDDAPGDTVFHRTRRLALYREGTAAPMWAEPWDDVTSSHLEKRLRPAGGGSLLAIAVSGGDADETIVLLLRRGTVREVLRHQVDYGEGYLALGGSPRRIVVEATGEVRVGGRVAAAEGRCPRESWAGNRLAFDDPRGEFEVEQGICIPRR